MTFRDIIRKVAEGFFVENFGFVRAVSSNFYGVEYMKLKIAFLQLVPDVNMEANIEKGIKACREAKANGADIALFPEM